MKKIDSVTYTFDKLIKNNNIYVDKTEYIYNMIMDLPMVFFARPRRFGKSLTVTTLKAIFEGKRDLFKDLAIDSKPYDWKIYPVIHIDFLDCRDNISPDELDKLLSNAILKYAKKYGVSLDLSLGRSNVLFSSLIEALAEKDDKVVILIDEYDKVLSDNYDSENLKELRSVLSDFYQIIKKQDANIRFAFITGVTKYSKLGVFSKMNNLADCSMDKIYACMCGYTQEELEKYFVDYIQVGIDNTKMDREIYLSTLKAQYDGYRFFPTSDSVYNPVSIGLFFRAGGDSFLDYWLDTGNTSMLMSLAKRVDFNIITDIEEPISASALNVFDITKLSKNPTDTLLKSLLYQTGYLTLVKSEDMGRTLYLNFPNNEVREGFCSNILNAYYSEKIDFLNTNLNLNKAFSNGDTKAAIALIKSIYASIPSNLETPNEGYYHSLLYTMLRAIDAKVKAEQMLF